MAERASRQLTLGELVAGFGGLILFVSLFDDWYGDRLGEFSAWTVFEVVDLILAVIALAAVGSAARRLLPAAERVRVPSAATIGWPGAAAVVIIFVNLVSDPPAASGFGLEAGIFIGLAGAILIVVGAVLSRARISLVVAPREPHAATEPTELAPENAGRSGGDGGRDDAGGEPERPGDRTERT